ncbi:hypothetical protein FB45DRAFT_1078654 [Roridomyces roridus]|uniref:F-box domain-containing protein n=1 Tax=Roridomyces roridus TaxID=1738132 RepID=A0AAD7CKR6_9AGAR|nr:hypothetical protein FB45DRAFT_1078654 [Roridomyces roridus]
MRDLPDELSDRICSFMDREDLCTTMHICSSLRRVAAAHLLCRLGISQSDVQAGTVRLALSDSLHLILFVAHVFPIKRLECFADTEDIQASDFQRLAPILGATAPIPDLVIHDELEDDQRKELETLPLLLAHLPQKTTDTLLIVVSSFNVGIASAACTGTHIMSPSPRAKLVLPQLILPDVEQGRILWLVFIGFNLLCMLIDVVLSLGPVFHRVFGYGFRSMEQISKDLFSKHPSRWSGGEIHVQSLSMKHTLVTCKSTPIRNPFVVQPLHGVSDSVHSTLLASIDIQFAGVVMISGSNVTLAQLAAFVARQENLRTLTCLPNSIRPSSLVSASPAGPHNLSQIVHLEAPASYIPHLLPLAPHVERIYLRFPSLPTVPIISIGPWFFDYTAYCTALDAIARLPGSHALALSFAFNPTAKNLPWHSSKVSQPEMQLHRVEHITLCTVVPYFRAYNASTIRALTPWLARFPSLRHVSFDEGAVETWYDQFSADEMPSIRRIRINREGSSTGVRRRERSSKAVRRQEISEAIAAVCTGMSGPNDVAFRITAEERMGSGLW